MSVGPHSCSASPKALLEVHHTGGVRQVAPEEVASHLLLKLRHIAEDYFGQAIEKAVIIAPAYFSDSVRAAIRDAGLLAGLKVVRLIQEATAVVMRFGMYARILLEFSKW